MNITGLKDRLIVEVGRDTENPKPHKGWRGFQHEAVFHAGLRLMVRAYGERWSIQSIDGHHTVSMTEDPEKFLALVGAVEAASDVRAALQASRWIEPTEVLIELAKRFGITPAQVSETIADLEKRDAE